MRKHIFLLLFFSFLFSRAHAQINQTTFGFLSFDKIESSPGENQHFPMLKKAWYSNSPWALVDKKVLYEKQSTLSISPVKGKDINTYFHFSNRDIVGKKLEG